MAVVSFVAVDITVDEGVAALAVDLGDTGVVDAVELASDLAEAGVTDEDCGVALVAALLVPAVPALAVVRCVAMCVAGDLGEAVVAAVGGVAAVLGGGVFGFTEGVTYVADGIVVHGVAADAVVDGVTVGLGTDVVSENNHVTSSITFTSSVRQLQLQSNKKQSPS